MGWRFKGEETYVLYGTYLQLIHVDEWQKPTQYYRAIILQLKINFKKDTCTSMFTAALFTIAKTWEQPKCPPTEEWIKKM